jgi:methylmalonyl-CoA/ethylmalonyl-CoA epimerase
VTPIRRLDHIAIVVRDTGAALAYFSDRLGLRVVHQDELDSPPVRLTYLDVGNTYLQLVEPRDPESELAGWLDEHGEGLHHVCFGVDDVGAAVEELADPTAAARQLGQGRGRVSAFVPNGAPHGVVVECTEFRREEDVDRTAGWLADAADAEADHRAPA